MGVLMPDAALLGGPNVRRLPGSQCASIIGSKVDADEFVIVSGVYVLVGKRRMRPADPATLIKSLPARLN